MPQKRPFSQNCTTLILGAGAAGMMTAIHAGPGVIVVDHAKSPGEKIRISGGGRCNFTNLDVEPKNFLGQNPHFHKSALARYTQWDFIELVDRHGIAWHEKTLGQLFCDGKATQIVDMLRAEMAQARAELWLETQIVSVARRGERYSCRVRKSGQDIEITCENIVLATGGKSIPKMGATGLAYDIARQFGHEVTETRAGLVPFTFEKGRFADLAGIALPATVQGGGARFDEGLLFTHRGLSGPAILQVSSYWREGEEIEIDLSHGADLAADLKAARRGAGKRALQTELAAHLPARVVNYLAQPFEITGNLADQSDKRIDALADHVKAWRLKPSGTEGYRTAEVTLGGIATDAFDSKTMMSRHAPGLYAVGEALDVTGWLGGYNFQWAWASGAAAGRAIKASGPKPC